MTELIPGRVLAVRERLTHAAHAASRNPQDITLLAVSKTYDHTAVRAAALAGQRDFGENYLQEALDKQKALANLDLVWHFIGPIQSNKTRGIAENFAWAHSVDRLKVAERLSAQRPDGLPPLNVCLEVNISGEASKGGVTPDALQQLAERVADLPRLCLRGLMAIPAPTPDPLQQRLAFQQVRGLFDTLNARGLSLDTLSMGMSGDFEAAIAEGSTLVRIGTALFGARHYPVAA
ncbi:MAG: YggS family pyridoxal phosphate enzyme [Hydrogenophilales bacterium 12-61-10]|nr:MAG: YggS family pyridoxal phosphate enzyme [Hydrogenophilales bacterium 12-61-10]OYX31764.1 MAG: YggS family pyridoxal phosphate enzyme [Hydrogenophilales bacterium 32-62-9]